MNGPTLPVTLSSTLADFRRRVWIVKLTEGILASLFGLALSYLLVLGLDRLMDTPAWLRGAILAAGAAVPGLGLPLKWHRWVWRQRLLEDAAKLLRWKFPALGDQLLGIVELSKDDGRTTGRSARLVEAAMAQADDAVKGKDLSKAVPHARHRQWAWLAATSLALATTAVVVINDAAGNAFQRWLMPWSDTARFTFARIEPLPDPLIVPLAEPFTLPMHLTATSPWKPSRASGRLPGQPRAWAHRESDGGFTLAFPPQTRDADLNLKVGDVRQSIRLQARPRPELTELQVRLTLPAYLQYETEPVIDVRGGSVSVLSGSQASFEIATSRPLAEATMDGEPVLIKDGRLLSKPISVVPEEKREVTFAWKDQLGLTALVPLALKVTPVDDAAPQLVARRDSLEQVVLDSEVIYFDLTASDDFGIRQAGLRWRGVEDSEGSTEGIKIAAAGDPERRELSARATFCAAREGVAPQTLEIRAWATDYLEGREPSQSATFILHVLNKTDHALWVTRQMSQWLDAAKETYEREQQLHQTNKALRALSAEELERPENLRQVAQQARAETANAERLSGLNQAGRKLVEQATKNPEFEAERLESWATLLQSLQDIAAARMPSVADLLEKSANAGAPPSSTNPDAKPAPTGEMADAGESGPQIKAGETSAAQGKPKPADPADATQPPVPSMSLTESTMNPQEPAEANADESQESEPGKGSFGLPSNSLAAAPGTPPSSPPASPAQESLDQGVTEQRDLLAEFARVSDQLSEILASLEASTFVKRLKAASREQLNLASGMRSHTLKAFGLEREEPAAASEEETPGEAPYVTPHAAVAAETASEQSQVVRVIQSDLQAYIQRRPDQHFKNVIAEMKATGIVSELEHLGVYASDNFNGVTIHAAEFWADTLDRWAEEMVKAGACSNCSSGSSDSLPPEIVLKVLQALRDEMALRDETRELENAKPELEELYAAMRAGKLASEQSRIREHTADAINDIVALPDGRAKFGKPLQLLSAVVQVMDEAMDILNHLETGDPAIAAETEAIELLLQTKRQNPNGGGGGGDSPGGGGGAARAALAALTDLGPGSDATSMVQARPVGQATGRAGRAFPEEFKTGLDAYFNHLETGAP